MIKPKSKYLKGLPEQYFVIKKGAVIDSDTLSLALHRIDVMVELLLHREQPEEDIIQDLYYILEGMIYQARRLQEAGEK